MKLFIPLAILFLEFITFLVAYSNRKHLLRHQIKGLEYFLLFIFLIEFNKFSGYMITKKPIILNYNLLNIVEINYWFFIFNPSFTVKLKKLFLGSLCALNFIMVFRVLMNDIFHFDNNAAIITCFYSGFLGIGFLFSLLNNNSFLSSDHSISILPRFWFAIACTFFYFSMLIPIYFGYFIKAHNVKLFGISAYFAIAFLLSLFYYPLIIIGILQSKNPPLETVTNSKQYSD